jgi:tetratricopeptide (TPR) repeat protein
VRLNWFRRKEGRPAQPTIAVRLRRANDALRKRDYGAAITAYQEMLTDDPENVGVLLNLGTALHLSGQHTRAIERFEQVLARDPQHVVGLINLAAAHGALGHLDKGIEALVLALEIDSTRRDLHYNLAALYVRKGQAANAMAELELELALHPDHRLARQTLTELRKQLLK